MFFYGPFDIPKKENWVLVGSGPSSDRLEDLCQQFPDIGIMTVSSLINKMNHVDVLVQSHYENYILSRDHFYKASLIYLPDPSHVGYRCQPMDAVNLYDKNYLDKSFPNKIRFYRKERDKNKATGNPSLYQNKTVATSCLHLLSLNDVSNVFILGIGDGGTGHSKRFDSIYKNISFCYDEIKREFFDFADYLGIKINLLETNLVNA